MSELLYIQVPLQGKTLSEIGIFEGYASVFGVIDRQQDQVMPGAFRKSLLNAEANRAMPKLLWQHDPAQPIGVWQMLKEDSTGLYVRGQLLLDLPRAQEAYVLLKAGAMDGLSIGYEVVQASKDRRSGIRQLLEVKLWEISLVTFAANTSARVTAVKQGQGDGLPEAQSPRLFEKFLRDAGFSRRQAVALTNHGWPGLKSLASQPRDAALQDTEYRQLVAKLRQTVSILQS
jgi:HK97 family phage prohead protease